MSRTSKVRDIGIFDLSLFKYVLSKDILKFCTYSTARIIFGRKSMACVVSIKERVRQRVLRLTDDCGQVSIDR